MTRLCTVAIVLASSLAAQAQIDPAAQELLLKAAQTPRDAKALHVRIHFESESKGRLNRSINKGDIVLIRDPAGRLRYENDDHAASLLLTWDGKTSFEVNADTREYARTETSQSPLNIERGKDKPVPGMVALHASHAFTRFDQMTQRIVTAQRLAAEEVSVDGKSVRCEVVRASYSAPPGMEGMESMERTFWIDTTRNLILQETGIARGKTMPSRPFDETETRRRTSYTWLVAGDAPAQGFDAALFRWEPASDYRAVDKIGFDSTRVRSPLVGRTAPELTLIGLGTGGREDRPVSLSSLRGKPVLLDFWATWCQPCRDQMPAMARLAASGKVQVVGISSDDAPELPRKFLTENKYEWLNLHDGKIRHASQAFGVSTIPTLVLIDSGGIIRHVERGHYSGSEQAVLAAIEALQTTPR